MYTSTAIGFRQGRSIGIYLTHNVIGGKQGGVMFGYPAGGNLLFRNIILLKKACINVGFFFKYITLNGKNLVASFKIIP